MKLRIIRLVTYLALVVPLSACTVLGIETSVPTSTDTPQTGLANPASVYCTENGNKNEIRTALDGSQSGVCIFPDGSECDEWAYFRGECGQATPTSPTPASSDNVPTKESNLEVGETASGGYLAPGTSEEFSDWWGVIKSTEPGAQYDDYFERQDLGGPIFFGIDSLDPVIKTQIEELRGSGQIVHLYGILFSNVPDYNGSQVQVSRIEVQK
jgi:putative hemolysin